MAKTSSPSARATSNKTPGLHSQANGGSSDGILEIVGRVAVGLDEESSSLDAITGETNELAGSLKETAAQAISLASSSEETA